MPLQKELFRTNLVDTDIGNRASGKPTNYISEGFVDHVEEYFEDDVPVLKLNEHSSMDVIMDLLQKESNDICTDQHGIVQGERYENGSNNVDKELDGPDSKEKVCSKTKHPSTNAFWRTEILITFSTSHKGQVAYVVLDQEISSRVPTETRVNVQCKQLLKPVLVVSAYVREFGVNCSYSLSTCRKKWSYMWHADKPPIEVNFLVVEDAHTTSRWETTTYEVLPTVPTKLHTQLQLESDWVLVDCDEHDIALFHQHQNEISQSVNFQTLHKSCKVQ